MRDEDESKSGCGNLFVFLLFLVWVYSRFNQSQEPQATDENKAMESARNWLQQPPPPTPPDSLSPYGSEQASQQSSKTAADSQHGQVYPGRTKGYRIELKWDRHREYLPEFMRGNEPGTMDHGIILQALREYGLQPTDTGGRSPMDRFNARIIELAIRGDPLHWDEQHGRFLTRKPKPSQWSYVPKQVNNEEGHKDQLPLQKEPAAPINRLSEMVPDSKTHSRSSAWQPGRGKPSQVELPLFMSPESRLFYNSQAIRISTQPDMTEETGGYGNKQNSVRKVRLQYSTHYLLEFTWPLWPRPPPPVQETNPANEGWQLGTASTSSFGDRQTSERACQQPVSCPVQDTLRAVFFSPSRTCAGTWPPW